MAHSPLRRLRVRSARPAVVASLVVALCFAQWIGFLHGVVHAGYDLPGRSVVSTDGGVARASADAAGDQRALAVRHSCAAFDAAALGATAPSVPRLVVASCDATAPLVAPVHGPTLPDARLAYLSRAPPAPTHA